MRLNSVEKRARSRWLRGRFLTASRTVLTVLASAVAVALAPALAAEPMSFGIASLGAHREICGRNCAEVITAQGEITNTTADDFSQFLASHFDEQALRPVILLHSPGGTVVGAMQLGKMFREMEAMVIVARAVESQGGADMDVAPGHCMSACVYAFFGGKRRIVPSVSELGIHRMVINEPRRNPAGGTEQQMTFGSQDFVSNLASYTKSMGVDPSVIQFAEQVAPNTIHICTPEEITRWRMGGR